MTFPLFKDWYNIHFTMYTFLCILTFFLQEAYIIPPFGKKKIQYMLIKKKISTRKASF